MQTIKGILILVNKSRELEVELNKLNLITIMML